MPLYARGARPQYTAKCEKRRGEEKKKKKKKKKKKRRKEKKEKKEEEESLFFFSVGTARAGAALTIFVVKRPILKI